jgi:hypothetical protein
MINKLVKLLKDFGMASLINTSKIIFTSKKNNAFIKRHRLSMVRVIY